MSKLFQATGRPATTHQFTRFCLLAGLAATLASPLASCKKDSDSTTATPSLIQPKRAKPTFGPTIQDQMQAVIEQFQDFNDPPLPTLTARQARMTHSVTDAVKTLLAKNNQVAPAANVTVSQMVLTKAYTTGSAPDGVPVRIYRPAGVSGTLPAIVYYHGGGWVIGSLDVYEPSAMALAERTGAIVISVDYRLASETMNKFPAAHEDAYAAYKWVRDNAASIGVNPAKIAVAGESAGGNMAVGVCILARERSYPLPIHQLLVYPVADNNLNTASYQQYATAVPLNKANVQYFTGIYFNTPADGDDRLISLVDVANLSGLPAATIIGAEIDPLQTEGQSLRDQLTKAGVSVQYQLYAGTTHEFFGTYAVVPPANDAETFAATRLKAAFQ
ncbi:MAG: alpha/beta hydrolase [Janthinobacterium lividum]